MKKAFLSFFLFLSFSIFSQTEGQDFCNGLDNGSYFPLNITKKKIYWYNTFYYETFKGEKFMKGKKYIEFEQKWEDGTIDILFLRNENGNVYQYDECCEVETVRFLNEMHIGFTWRNAEEKIEYTYISNEGKLKTPFCAYKNLLVLRAKYVDAVYDFFYLKGLGYVGATENGKLISGITPKM